MSISENLVHDGPLRFFSRQEAKVRTYETSTSETKNAIIKPKVVDRVRWVVMCCDVKRPMVLFPRIGGSNGRRVSGGEKRCEVV